MFCKIEANDTYKVRHQELRPGKPIESCIFDGDDLPSTLHFGYQKNNQIIAVVSVFKQEKTIFENIFQYQIRGMAVLTQYQGKGIGKKLFSEMEQFLIDKKIQSIWFNARTLAVPFYKNLECKIITEPFEIQDVGVHFVMYKKLN